MRSALGCPSRRRWGGSRRDLGDWQKEKVLRGQARSTLWQATNDMLGRLVSMSPAIERKPKV